MRRALLFVLVFALGGGLLWLASRGGPFRNAPARTAEPAVEGAEGPPGAAPAPQGAPGAPGEAAPAQEPGAEEPLFLRIRGQQIFDLYGESEGPQRPRLYHVEGRFEPLDASFRTYQVSAIQVEQFDPATGALLNSIRAERARVRIEGASRETVRLAEGGRLELEEVTLERRAGHELAPLVLRAPALEAWLDRQRFESTGDGEVTIEGRGLSGRGLGLVYDGSTGHLALSRGGELTIERPAEGRAHLATPRGGALEVERGAAPGQLELRARDGARLSVEGTRESIVEAASIAIRARRAEPGGEDRVVLEHVTASGAVVATRGDERYAGDSAELFADETGRLQRVVLEREPSARLVVAAPDGTPTPIVASGAGPLVVDLERDWGNFELTGPARVGQEEPGGLVLGAEGSLAGSSDADGRRLTVSAQRAVRVQQGERRLDTEALVALFLAGREPSVRLVGDGPTRMSGPDAEGGTLTVDVEGESEVQAVGERWTVPLARSVHVTALGPRAFRANIGLLRDLDWDGRTFRADEGVSWSSAFGEGDAAEVVRESADLVRLVGRSGSPARFHVRPGRIDPQAVPEIELARFGALEIELRPDRLNARGEVHGTVQGLGETYDLRAEEAQLALGPQPTAGEGESPPRSFTLTAERVERVQLSSPDGETLLAAAHLHVEGALVEDSERLVARADEVRGEGGVSVEQRGDLRLIAEGDRFVRRANEAHLWPAAGGRVVVTGTLPDSLLPFRMEADDFEWDGTRLRAARPELSVTAPFVSEGGRVIAGPVSLSAEHFLFDESGLLLEGSARLDGTDPEGIALRVRAARLRLGGEFEEGGSPQQWSGAFRSFSAEGGFSAVYGGLGIARGERLVLTQQRLAIHGVEDRPASFEGAGYSFDTQHVVLDLESFLPESGRGVLRGLETTQPWDFEFAAIQPKTSAEGTFLAVVSPRWIADEREARCHYVALWIDAERWRAKGRERLLGEPLSLPEEAAPAPRRAAASERPHPDLVPNVFRRLGRGDLPRYLRAVHLEGAIEVIEKGKTSARFASVYLDLERKRGWLEEAELIARTDVGSHREAQIQVRAEHLRAHADGSLRARGATITTSKFDEPNYVIETDLLLLEPVKDDLFRFGAKGNRIRFRNGLRLPLPSFGNLALDAKGDVVGFVSKDNEHIKTIDYVHAGQVARFGTTIGTAFRYDIGRVGRRIGDWVGFDADKLRGKWYTEGSYLGSRGPLLGLGLEVTEEGRNDAQHEEFWFKIYGHGIPDRGEDRGLLRVPEEDRDTFRSWIHGRARYPYGDHEWIDVAATHQSDPGVQAEFYQSEFQRYEERDTYVHWRRADGDRYLDASVAVRGDGYRTALEQRPSAGVYRGEHEIARWGAVPLLHGWGASIDNLRRLEGDLAYEDPFVGFDGLPDGLGDREVVRGNLDQRFSAPFALGIAGLRATPWLRGSATAWDQTLEEDEGASRLGLVGGLDLATTLLRGSTSGHLHSLTPKLTYREDLAVSEDGGGLVRFDQLDDPLEGREVGAGVRALWWSPRAEDHLDLELMFLHQTDRGEDLPERELVQVLGDWRTHLGSMPAGVLHDGRFDLDSGTTLYSLSTFAIQPAEPLILEVSYRRGVDVELEGLFETASFDGRWRFDPKWEIQLGQDVAVKGGGTLKSDVIVRRFSADFLFEFEVDYRSGEGGTSFGINFAPLFLWRPSGLGILER